jgi:hypothetical protein
VQREDRLGEAVADQQARRLRVHEVVRAVGGGEEAHAGRGIAAEELEHLARLGAHAQPRVRLQRDRLRHRRRPARVAAGEREQVLERDRAVAADGQLEQVLGPGARAGGDALAARERGERPEVGERVQLPAVAGEELEDDVGAREGAPGAVGLRGEPLAPEPLDVDGDVAHRRPQPLGEHPAVGERACGGHHAGDVGPRRAGQAPGGDLRVAPVGAPDRGLLGTAAPEACAASIVRSTGSADWASAAGAPAKRVASASRRTSVRATHESAQGGRHLGGNTQDRLAERPGGASAQRTTTRRTALRSPATARTVTVSERRLRRSARPAFVSGIETDRRPGWSVSRRAATRTVLPPRRAVATTATGVRAPLPSSVTRSAPRRSAAPRESRSAVASPSAGAPRGASPGPPRGQPPSFALTALVRRGPLVGAHLDLEALGRVRAERVAQAHAGQAGLRRDGDLVALEARGL